MYVKIRNGNGVLLHYDTAEIILDAEITTYVKLELQLAYLRDNNDLQKFYEIYVKLHKEKFGQEYYLELVRMRYNG